MLTWRKRQGVSTADWIESNMEDRGPGSDQSIPNHTRMLIIQGMTRDLTVMGAVRLKGGVRLS